MLTRAGTRATCEKLLRFVLIMARIVLMIWNRIVLYSLQARDNSSNGSGLQLRLWRRTIMNAWDREVATLSFYLYNFHMDQNQNSLHLHMIYLI